jgi:two-component system, NarL family, sensor histidine kinase UhpB
MSANSTVQDARAEAPVGPSDLQRARAALEAARARYEELYELAPIGHLTLDAGGTITEINRTGCTMLGCSREAAIGTSFAARIAADQAERFAAHLREVQQRRCQISVELALDVRDSACTDVRLNSAPSGDGARSSIHAIIVDITESKRAAEALHESRAQLRKLAQHIEAAREKERTRIARDLHEEFGQILTVLKLGLTSQPREPASPEQYAERTHWALGLVDRLIREVQRICKDLHPVVLDHLGLGAALDWFVNGLAEHTPIRFNRNFAAAAIARDPARDTQVFRILQEALTNVVRHSRATEVDISLEAADGRLTLAVEDNGIGISPQDIRDPNSLGLLGLRERADWLGGRIEIEPGATSGTRIVLTVPLTCDEMPNTAEQPATP